MFSKEDVDKLFEVWEKDEPVIIKGINARGEEFETKGRITVDDKGEPGIYEDWIMVEFGERTEERETGRDRAECYAPYQTELKYSEFASGLVILSIQDEQGKEIFANPKAQEIKETAEKIKTRHEERQKEDGTELYGEDDFVTENLKSLIGQPIQLNRRKAVLASINGCTKVNGETMLTIFDGTLEGSTFVEPYTRLQWVDTFTGEKNSAINTPRDAQKVFDARLRYNRENLRKRVESENEDQ